MDQLKPPAPIAAPPPETRLHFLDYWRVIRIRKAIIITVFLITALIATAVTLILPESFASTATIKVENEGAIIPNMEGGQAAQGYTYDPFFIQTTFEIMKSQLVLTNVINTLGLNDVWGKKYNNGEALKTTETMEILKDRMALAPVRNTKMIAITVFSEDKNEAADLANQIAKAYQSYREQNTKQIQADGLRVLEQQLSAESNQIQSVTTNIYYLRTSLHIMDDGGPESLTPTPTIEKKRLDDINGKITDDEQAYSREFVVYSALDGLYQTNRELLKDVLPQMDPDTELSSAVDELKEAIQAKNKYLVDYNPTNLIVARVESLVDTLNQQISNRVDGIMAGLKTQLDATQMDLLNLSNEVEQAKEQDFTNTVTYEPYYEQKRQLEDLRTMYNLLESKVKMASIDYQLPTYTMVQITDPAEPGKVPVKPNKPLNIAMGLVFGFIMGIGLAFFIEYLDTSVKTIDDVERTFQAPVLGVIPQNIGYLIEEGSESKHAEAYRVLRTNLLFSRQDEKLNTIVIVSAGAGEGKSTTTLNLATVFAQAGNRVLIVDSDLRRPTLHKLFKVANNLGLTNYLLKQNTLVEIVQTTQVPNLDFMASGKLPNSAMGILGSTQMKEMISELKQRYDFIFFDSPPILGVSDASILASEVDLVMQVVQYRRYPQPMTIRAKQMIEKVGGNFAGIVLNNINMSQDEGYYYYSGYYHDYYYSRTPGEQDTDAKAATKSDEGDTEMTTRS
ncbi:MAG TPA: polysaccharide biosynthesis tyrosine autokinase [Candidatus Sulfotelmatobacter sp.]|nr:polysaccharide biosynthesis tyrosine autokinase [Candidatus Sulfotelmatobacter sp.]